MYLYHNLMKRKNLLISEHIYNLVWGRLSYCCVRTLRKREWGYGERR